MVEMTPIEIGEVRMAEGSSSGKPTDSLPSRKERAKKANNATRLLKAGAIFDQPGMSVAPGDEHAQPPTAKAAPTARERAESRARRESVTL